MKLKKGISFLGVFSIASGAMISSGIFVLAGLAYAKAGPAVFISYLLAGILALLGVFSLIELSTAMPKDGGDYFFINKTLGSFFGTISGFMGWFSLSLKSAFAIFGISEIILLYTGMNPLLSGFLLTLFFVLINIIGIKEAVIFQIIMIVGLISILLAYIFLGLPKINPANFTPFFRSGINEILITSGFVFISFGGLLKVANLSEEIINPKKNIPLGIISSVIVVTLLYTFITVVITGTLPPEVFKKTFTPVADSAKLIMGTLGYTLIIIASFLAFFTTANAGIMSASRYPLALSRDNLLPKKFAVVHPKFKTPILSIFVTGFFIFLYLLLPLEMLVKAASTIILTSYVLTNLSVIIFRESKITNYKPSFKAPFYPWLQIFSIFLFSFFIIELGSQAIELSFSFLFICVVIYMAYGRKVKKKDYALLHVLKRIADQQILENTLEDELRDIIANRDNIEQDNFDSLLREANFYDFDDKMEYKDLIQKVADYFSKQTNIDKNTLIEKFMKRQKEYGTVVSDFLAIPHIIIEGKNQMLLTIVRNKKGFIFSDKDNSVKAVFILIGTKDKRLLHLKALASIANLVSQKNFQTDWLNAKNTVELKNLMILNNRKRIN